MTDATSEDQPDDVLGPLRTHLTATVDELEAGRKPYCVSACMMRVLDVGPIDQLRDGTYQTKARGPNDQVVSQVRGMADPDLTKPSIVFIPHSKGRVDG